MLRPVLTEDTETTAERGAGRSMAGSRQCGTTNTELGSHEYII